MSKGIRIAAAVLGGVLGAVLAAAPPAGAALCWYIDPR